MFEEDESNKFPFNQPDGTRDCGYRCAYYCIGSAKSDKTYEGWLDQFKHFNPTVSGINFNDICNILSYYKVNSKFTELTDSGLYIVYSGIWLHPEGKKHGHYFVYQDGYVLCSTHKTMYRMRLPEVVKRLEAKTVELAYRSLRVG